VKKDARTGKAAQRCGNQDNLKQDAIAELDKKLKEAE
jgi:hypothetical protein